MKLIYTLFLSLICSCTLWAQPIIQWDNTISASNTDETRSGVQTSDGGYIIVGNSNSNASGDKTENSNGLTDIWVVKLDANGAVQWDNTIGGSGTDVSEDIIQTSDGGYLIAGRSNSNISGDKTENSQGGWDYWVLKLNASGAIQWQNTIGGTSDDFLRSVIQTSDGGFLLGGDSDSGAGGDKTEISQGMRDYWIVKIDALGNLVWQNAIGSNGMDLLYALVEISDGSIIVAGFSNTGISGDKTSAGYGGSDYWVLKLSNTGSIIWQETYGGSSGEQTRCIVNVADTAVLIGGYSGSGISGNKTEASNGSLDFWAILIDTSSTIIWQNALGGNLFDEMNDAYYTSDGGFILGGTSNSVVSGDKSEGTLGTAASDYWVVKLNASGVLEWENTIGGDDQDELFAIKQTDDSGYILFGTSASDIGFDKTENTAGLRDYWIVKLTCDGTDVDQDGYCTNTDCNDNDPLVNPGMTEIQCNGIDDDCNPLTLDDDVTDPETPILADSAGECSVTLVAPTTTDNCAGTITGTTTDPLTYNSEGNYVVNWTFDDGNGNSIVVPQNVIIDDVTDPATIVLADSIGQCFASVPVPTTTDNCGGVITGSTTFPLSYSTQGQFIVYWTFDDGNGNFIVVPQTVLVDDTTDPDLPILPDLIGECSVTAIAPTTSDNCAGAITGTTTDPLSYSMVGNHVINWTFDDGNGNSIVVPQNIQVLDTIAPVAPTLADIEEECSVTPVAPIATDACEGSITGTTTTSFPITAQGTTTITWVFDDGNGNTSTADQAIILLDETDPVPDSNPLSGVNSECDVTSLTPPTATDNCGGTVAVTNDATLPITANTTVTWTYDDGNGNTTTQTQNVIVTPIDNGITQVDALTLSADATGYSYQWVNCDNGNAPISGATNQNFTATTNSNYAVEVSNGICTVISSCITIDEVGITDLEGSQGIRIYPNPSESSFFLSFSDENRPIQISVVNVAGQKVSFQILPKNNIWELSIDGSPGIYFIETISAENSSAILRVSKY